MLESDCILEEAGMCGFLCSLCAPTFFYFPSRAPPLSFPWTDVCRVAISTGWGELPVEQMQVFVFRLSELLGLNHKTQPGGGRETEKQQ